MKDHSETKTEIQPNGNNGALEENEPTTKLDELSAKVSDQLTKIGSGGPWVWYVFFLNYFNSVIILF